MLRCAECGTTSSDGIGWRALLATDIDDDDEPVPVEAVVYCPACALREFGPGDE